MTTSRLYGDLKISDLLMVRTSILEISKRAFNKPALDRLQSGQKIAKEREKAKKAGQKAENFDPHSRVFLTLRWISIRKEILGVVVSIVGLTVYFGLGVSEEIIIDVISITSSPILLFGVSGVTIYLIWNLYVLSLRYNKKLIRDLNKEIRYSDQKIDSETSVENVKAYYRWNSILTNSSSISIILLLATVNSFFPSLFLIGIQQSREWVPEYVDTKVNEIIEDSSDENMNSDRQKGS